MDNDQISRLEASFAAVAPQGEHLVRRFYARLFEVHPGVRPLFPDDLTEQEGKLLASLSLVVSSLRALEGLVPLLKGLGRRHVAYGAIPAHYAAVRDALLDTLAEVGADAWSEQLTSDWHAAIDLVAQTMLSGANAPT
jgi:hemoglobin-like flavoprotein